MKKLLAILVLVLFGTMSYAQWQGTSPGNLWMTGGNVGIGTNSPGQDIHILDATGPAVVMTESGYNSATTKTLGGLLVKHNTTGDQLFMAMKRTNGTTNEFLLSGYVSSLNAWSEFMYFNFTTQKYEIHSGVTDVDFQNSSKVLFNNAGTVLFNNSAVGIGTGAVAIPAGVKLAVNGKVNCKEIEVTLSGWSDFVFNPSYKLRSLYEVENFINLNKHLPDVPSEAEVLKNGANLGQMDALLLQKIEELTLYVIELKKENDLLKDRIKPLEK